MDQIQLSNHQAPGDVLMMTCAVRDLQVQYPGRFSVGLHPGMHAPAIFEGNPHISQLNTTRAYREFKLGYSTAIQQCNQRVGHFAQGFTRDLSEKLGLSIQPRQMRPEVFLTEHERDPETRFIRQPYWVVVAGGKKDFTAKLWAHTKYQEVVRQLRSDVYFVQAGSREANHLHMPLTGVTDLLGRTTLRQLMSLVYHSDGVVCPVTCVMHLAAAFNKPCVVIAGGREPWWWEAYTRTVWAASCAQACPADFVEHRYLHTIGALSCCRKGGCWKSGVGEKRLGKNCRHMYVTGTQRQPECMTRITAQHVVDAVHAYLRGDPVVPEVLPAVLRTPAVALQALPATAAEAASQAQTQRAPRRVYGPKRKGEHVSGTTQPVVSLGALRAKKVQRWRGSVLRPRI